MLTSTSHIKYSFCILAILPIALNTRKGMFWGFFESPAFLHKDIFSTYIKLGKILMLRINGSLFDILLTILFRLYLHMFFDEFYTK